MFDQTQTNHNLKLAIKLARKSAILASLNIGNIKFPDMSEVNTFGDTLLTIITARLEQNLREGV